MNIQDLGRQTEWENFIWVQAVSLTSDGSQAIREGLRGTKTHFPQKYVVTAGPALSISSSPWSVILQDLNVAQCG